jgi:hypothetical protein
LRSKTNFRPSNISCPPFAARCRPSRRRNPPGRAQGGSRGGPGRPPPSILKQPSVVVHPHLGSSSSLSTSPVLTAGRRSVRNKSGQRRHG